MEQKVELPIFLMLIGIPGSGKSSWLATFNIKDKDDGTSIFINKIPFTIICPDLIWNDLGKMEDRSLRFPVWKEARRRTVECLEKNMSVILDATNVDTVLRRQFIEGLPPCRKMAKIFSAGPEQAYLRIKKDIEESKPRANVPEHVVYRMYGDFLYTLRVISSEGFELIKEI